MQKKILIVFFIGLFLGVIGVLYSFLNYADTEFIETKEYLSPLDKKVKVENFTKSWIDSLVKSKKSAYLYPVNKLFIHIDLQKYIPPKVRSFKLIIQNMDRYSLFCVMQTLQSFNLPFIVSKDKALPFIYIGSSSEKKLKNIEKKLRNYDIDSKVMEE